MADEPKVTATQGPSGIEKAEMNVGTAAKTVFQTAQTKKGRLGYILVFALGVLVGGLLVLGVRGC